MEKITEPDDAPRSYRCPSCSKYYCYGCIKRYTIHFKIETNQKKIIEWEGKRVCPWCYNWFIDLKARKEMEAILDTGRITK